MFCKNCGASITSKSDTCPSCGAEQTSTPSREVPKEYATPAETYQAYAMPKEYPEAPVTKSEKSDKSKSSKPAKANGDRSHIVAISVVSVILIVAVVLTAVFLFVQKNNNANNSALRENNTTNSLTEATKEQFSTLSVSEYLAESTVATSPSSEPTSETSETSSQSVEKSTAATERTETNTSANSQTPAPKPSPARPSIFEAERVAKTYCYNICTQDLVPIIESEIVGMNNVSKVFDENLKTSTGSTSVAEAYRKVSADMGITVTDAKEYINYMLMASNVDQQLSSLYGSDYTITTSVIESYYVSEEDAASYVSRAKKSIGKALPSDSVNWGKITDFAIVSVKTKISGSKFSDYCNYNIFLGYINGKWKVISFEENGTELELNSVSFLRSFS